MVKLKDEDIQGFMFSSYARNLHCAAYLLLRITERESSRRWLGEMVDNITTGKQKSREERRKDIVATNIAFTSSGLKKLGFSEEELSTFSRPFQEGMVTEPRAKTLSDTGDSDPKNWKWGNPDNPVDILLMVFAVDENVLAEQLKLRRAEISADGGLQEVAILPQAGRQPDMKEHFGYLDGVGQPIIEGSGKAQNQLKRTGHATVIRAGEFILGYENELGVLDSYPRTREMPEFGVNGTYLVFRQMEQHVNAFWAFLEEATRRSDGTSDPDARERLGAKIVGRWKSGAPVTKHPDRDPYQGVPPEIDENDFGYNEHDHHGFGCPIGAHIRRSNPRDSLPPNPETALQSAKRHRIIRQGRSYGDHAENVFVEDNKERGLHFICLNSDIERQFEFIQQTWINNKKFGGLYDEVDPLVGRHKSGNLFTIQDDPLRTRVRNLLKFVTIKGGSYFFMPGISALRYIAGPKKS
ncbi:MAG TPA: Dyp-type peroxidase [Pyrinomonadaceae bacterium]|jgi:Dyp-type peroxidase family